MGRQKGSKKGNELILQMYRYAKEQAENYELNLIGEYSDYQFVAQAFVGNYGSYHYLFFNGLIIAFIHNGVLYNMLEYWKLEIPALWRYVHNFSRDCNFSKVKNKNLQRLDYDERFPISIQ